MLHLFRSELTFCWYFNSVSLTFKHIHESRETRQAFIFELALFIRPKSEKWWLKFGRDFEAEFRSILWGWCLVEIFETFDMTCYTSSHLVRALKPWVGCAFGNFYFLSSWSNFLSATKNTEKNMRSVRFSMFTCFSLLHKFVIDSLTHFKLFVDSELEHISWISKFDTPPSLLIVYNQTKVIQTS